MAKHRLSINERAELVMRDGTVVGRLSAISVEIDSAAWGAMGGALELGERKSPDGDSPPSPQVTELQAPEGKLFEAPSPELQVWEHWLKATASAQKLDSTRRGIIRNALKLRSVEQCCEAIDGLVNDPWWRTNRPRLELRYALRGNHAKGESDEDRIDKMREKACSSTSGKTTVAQLLATVPSEAHDIVRSRMEKVIAATRSDREATKHAAETALRQLREHPPYIEPEYADGKVTGWRRVRNG